jgi:hypothetical protein
MFTEGNINPAVDDALDNTMGPYLESFMTEAYNYAKTHSRVKGLFIYELLDEPNIDNQEGHFGLVYVGKDMTIGATKDAYKTVQALMGGGPRTASSTTAPSTTAPSSSRASSKAASTPKTSSVAPNSQSSSLLSSSADSSISESSSEAASLASSTHQSSSAGTKNGDSKSPWLFIIIIIAVILLAGAGVTVYLIKFKFKK